MIIGIDPGYRSCGVCLLDRKGTEWRAIKVVTVRTPSTMPLHARMAKVYWAIYDVYTLCNPILGTIIACEEQAQTYSARSGAGESNKEALLVQQVVGIARAIALRVDLELVEVPPQAAKIAVLGRGGASASKAQLKKGVLSMVRGLPAARLLSEHAADAVATAIAGARRAQWEEQKRRASTR